MTNKKSKKNEIPENWLIFVDTNIFLDFYRNPGKSAKNQLLELYKHQGSLIFSEQIWMEFLKNRHKVLLESLKNLIAPSKISFPSILNEYQAAKSLTQNNLDSLKNYKKVETKIISILERPSRHDFVYSTLKKIFVTKSNLTLKRPNNERFNIRKMAEKRFNLGYPPRKKSDTSYGDAVNWEWIVECAKNHPNKHIIIVSRDGDYGQNYNNNYYINDALAWEFKDRASSKQKLILTNKLTDAFEKLKISVSQEAIDEEKEILKSGKSQYSHNTLFEENLFEFIQQENFKLNKDLEWFDLFFNHKKK